MTKIRLLLMATVAMAGLSTSALAVDTYKDFGLFDNVTAIGHVTAFGGHQAIGWRDDVLYPDGNGLTMTGETVDLSAMTPAIRGHFLNLDDLTMFDDDFGSGLPAPDVFGTGDYILVGMKFDAVNTDPVKDPFDGKIKALLNGSGPARVDKMPVQTDLWAAIGDLDLIGVDWELVPNHEGHARLGGTAAGRQMNGA